MLLLVIYFAVLFLVNALGVFFIFNHISVMAVYYYFLIFFFENLSKPRVDIFSALVFFSSADSFSFPD